MSTLALIKEAIIALKDRTGSSTIAINKWLETEKKTEVKKHLMKAALARGVATGELVKVKASYKVSAEGKKKAKKPAAAKAKKPVTKKAAPKKKTTTAKKPAAKKSATPKKTATKKATATKPKKTATKPKKTATKKKTTKAAEAKQ